MTGVGRASRLSADPSGPVALAICKSCNLGVICPKLRSFDSTRGLGPQDVPFVLSWCMSQSLVAGGPHLEYFMTFKYSGLIRSIRARVIDTSSSQSEYLMLPDDGMAVNALQLTSPLAEVNGKIRALESNLALASPTLLAATALHLQGMEERSPLNAGTLNQILRPTQSRGWDRR
ncbi:hypothetical protein C8R44DRAFT_740139 [Mycena epipterygia]|nr:hypothetical protein C8R44DRAFT_740139 [Mycena epipterygia]